MTVGGIWLIGIVEAVIFLGLAKLYNKLQDIPVEKLSRGTTLLIAIISLIPIFGSIVGTIAIVFTLGLCLNLHSVSDNMAKPW